MRLRLVFDPSIGESIRVEVKERLGRHRDDTVALGEAVLPAPLPHSSYTDLWRVANDHVSGGWDLVALFVSHPLPDNFFARTPDGEGASRMFVVRVEDFSWITPAPQSAVLAHLVAKKLLDAAAEVGGLAHSTLFHIGNELGCAFDLCAKKGELVRRLRSGDICNRCLHALESAGVDEALLRFAIAVLQDSRKDSLHASRFLSTPGNRVFDRWPFPVAVTRHKAANERGERQLQFLLDHFDSLVRYVCIVENAVSGRSLASLLPDSAISLGWWVTELGRLGADVPTVRKAHRIAERHKIVAIRNDEAHSWSIEDGALESAEALRALESAIEGMEAALAPWFESHRLAVIRQNGVALSGNELSIRVDLAQGSNTLFESRTLLLPEGSAPASRGITLDRAVGVFVATPDLSRFTSLTPLVIYEICGRCRHHAMLVADGRGRYLDPKIGHRGSL